MKISKELFTAKKYADGSSPVMIRINHRGIVKRICTSIKCDINHWNEEKECVTDKDVGHRHKNEEIEAAMRRVAGRIQDFLDDCLSRQLDNLSSLLPEEYCTEGQSVEIVRKEATSFLSIIDKKIESTGSLNTKRGYNTFRKYFNKRFGYGPCGYDINQKFVYDVVSALEKDYPADSSMRHLIGSRFNAILNFGKANALIPASFNARMPKYRLLPGDRNLSEDELRIIFNTFYSGTRGGFHIDDLRMLSLSLFILDIAFQGLAPVDLASLKINDLRFSTIYAPIKPESAPSMSANPTSSGKEDRDSMEVVAFTTLRKKTGQPVSVIACLKPIEPIIKTLTDGKAPDDYLIPCFVKSKSYSPERCQNRLANFFYKMSVYLNETINDNRQAPHLFKNKVTYYFARHAYCNIVDSLDIPRHIIQNLVGHRSTVLEKSYLRPISNWEQAVVSREIFRILMP